MPANIGMERVLGQAFRNALGDRLVALAAYGSSVDDSWIPGFSDLDLAVFMHGVPSAADAVATQRSLRDLDSGPFAYVQAKFLDVDEPPHQAIVPGAFRVFWGAIPNVAYYLHDDQSLRSSGKGWLRALPDLVAEDNAAWSVAAGSARRQRLIRLLMTRLKPAVRAMLVEEGESPSVVWLANWTELASRWGNYDPDAGEVLASLLVALPPANRAAELDCGEAILRLLERIVPRVCATSTG